MRLTWLSLTLKTNSYHKGVIVSVFEDL
jgi:hypothetical protein